MTTRTLPRGRHVVLTDHVRLVHSGICRTMRDACRAASLRYRPEAIAPLRADVLHAARVHADRRRFRRVSHEDLTAAHRSALDWRRPMGHKGPRYPD